MRHTKTVITAGLAMFSMFFGSANLVFPVAMGAQTLDQAIHASIGLFITGVVVPFLGLISMILYNGDRQRFFNTMGPIFGFLIVLIMLSLLGPFGVVPRCIVVAYGGIQLFMPNLSLFWFAISFSLVTAYVIWKGDRIIPIIGRVLTPIFLGGIIIVIIMGLYHGEPSNVGEFTKHTALKHGMVEGYQMMDLLAAFFFASTAMGYINVHLTDKENPKLLLKLSLYASIIAMALLGLIYVAFVILGAKYAPQLANVPPEQLLVTIAGLTLGKFATPVMSVTITLACLTTATALTIFFADFLSNDISRGRINRHLAIVITLVISIFFSLQGFGGIKTILATILSFIYPALIALAIGCILRKMFKLNFNIAGWAFWATLCAVAFLK